MSFKPETLAALAGIFERARPGYGEDSARFVEHEILSDLRQLIEFDDANVHVRAHAEITPAAIERLKDATASILKCLDTLPPEFVNLALWIVVGGADFEDSQLALNVERARLRMLIASLHRQAQQQAQRRRRPGNKRRPQLELLRVLPTVLQLAGLSRSDASNSHMVQAVAVIFEDLGVEVGARDFVRNVLGG